MLGNRDIWQAAKLLVDSYGKSAALHAAHRADELFDEGDLNGRAVWLRIAAAVHELVRTTIAQGESRH